MQVGIEKKSGRDHCDEYDATEVMDLTNEHDRQPSSETVSSGCGSCVEYNVSKAISKWSLASEKREIEMFNNSKIYEYSEADSLGNCSSNGMEENHKTANAESDTNTKLNKTINEKDADEASCCDSIRYTNRKVRRRDCLKTVSKKVEIVSWALLDAVSSIITSVVFGLYPSFAQQTIFKLKKNGVKCFIIANSIVCVVTALMLVSIGGMADVLYLKKYIAVVSIAISSVSCIMLKFAVPSQSELDNTPSIIFMLAMYILTASFAQVIDAVASSLLTVVSSRKNIGLISGLGNAFGQITGVISLVVVNVLSYHGESPLNEEDRTRSARSYGNIMVILGVVLLVLGVLPTLFLHDHKPVELKRANLAKGLLRKSWERTVGVGKFAVGNGKTLGFVIASLLVLVIGMFACDGMSSNVFLYSCASSGIGLKDIELIAVVTSMVSAISSIVVGVVARFVSQFWLGILTYSIKLISLVLSACVGLLEGQRLGSFILIWTSSILRAFSNGPLFSVMRTLISQYTPKKTNSSGVTFFFTYAFICIATLVGCVVCSTILGAIENDTGGVYTAKFFSFPLSTTVLSFVMYCIIRPGKNKEMTTSEEYAFQDSGPAPCVSEVKCVIQVNEVECEDKTEDSNKD